MNSAPLIAPFRGSHLKENTVGKNGGQDAEASAKTTCMRMKVLLSVTSGFPRYIHPEIDSEK